MFKPTYLYVKTHNTTGLKYFGKTCKKDPYKYKGSGTRWNNHLGIHGNNCTTEIIGLFTDREECLRAALEFSVQNDIVVSPEWANLKLESLDGGWDHITTENINKGIESFRCRPQVEQDAANAKKAQIGKDNFWYGKERGGAKNPRFGAIVTEEQKLLQSAKMSGMYTYYDSNGISVRTRVNDARVANGELTARKTGTVVVKDGAGETLVVKITDPRFLQGELVSVNKNRKMTDEQKLALSEKV